MTATSADAAPIPASSLQVERLPIADLHPDPCNPRRIAEAELAALTRSIATFGWVAPVLAPRADRRVIVGHQRLIAARRAGLTTVPVILLDLSAEDARLLNVALNRIGGAWDQDLLARLLIDLRATTARDLTLSGFAEADLQDPLTRFDQREKRDRPERFDLEEALATYDREASGIAPGAGWQLGAHRLFRGDATDAAFVARCLGGQPADLVFTDPPSNVAYGAHGGKAADRPAHDDAVAEDDSAISVVASVPHAPRGRPLPLDEGREGRARGDRQLARTAAAQRGLGNARPVAALVTQVPRANARWCVPQRLRDGAAAGREHCVPRAVRALHCAIAFPPSLPIRRVGDNDDRSIRRARSPSACWSRVSGFHGNPEGQDHPVVRADGAERQAGAVPRLQYAAGDRGGLHPRRAAALHRLRRLLPDGGVGGDEHHWTGCGGLDSRRR